MGVDLTLMPLLGPGFWCAHDMLKVNRRSELWDKIDQLDQMDVPGPLTCYRATIDRGEESEHTGYGDVEEDPYGKRLRWTTAGQLMTLGDDPLIQEDWSNRAIWAFLSHLPHHWPIVLYWH